MLGSTLLALALFAPADVQSSATAPFYNFESGQVRPLLLSPDGLELYVANTPDARVEVFDALAMTSKGSVFTGLEPVAMALNPDRPRELWVANQLSDSIAVVDLDTLQITDTIPVGDEPLDVAFASGKAFVTCARAPSSIPNTWDQNVVVALSAKAPHTRLAQLLMPHLRPRSLAVINGQVHVLSLH